MSVCPAYLHGHKIPVNFLRRQPIGPCARGVAWLRVALVCAAHQVLVLALLFASGSQSTWSSVDDLTREGRRLEPTKYGTPHQNGTRPIVKGKERKEQLHGVGRGARRSRVKSSSEKSKATRTEN